jgi:hypothetical protein
MLLLDASQATINFAKTSIGNAPFIYSRLLETAITGGY